MSFTVSKKYQANINLDSSVKTKKAKTFWDLAKKHIVKGSGKKENLALSVDNILYGRK